MEITVLQQKTKKFKNPQKWCQLPLFQLHFCTNLRLSHHMLVQFEVSETNSGNSWLRAWWTVVNMKKIEMSIHFCIHFYQFSIILLDKLGGKSFFFFLLMPSRSFSWKISRVTCSSNIIIRVILLSTVRSIWITGNDSFARAPGWHGQLFFTY